MAEGAIRWSSAMRKVVARVESLLDERTALGDVDALLVLSQILADLSAASAIRGTSVRLRLEGVIAGALESEERVERILGSLRRRVP